MEKENQSIGGVYNRCHEVSKKEERTQKINKIKHLELNKPRNISWSLHYYIFVT